MNYFVFLNSSLSGGIIKGVSESESNGNQKHQYQIINVSLIIYLLIGCFVWFILNFFGYQLTSQLNIENDELEVLRSLLTISSIFAIVIWPLKVFEAVFIGLMRHGLLNLVKGIVSVISTLSLIICLKHEIELENILQIFYFVGLFLGGVLTFIYYFKNPEYRFNFDGFSFKVASPIIKFSLSIMVLEIISMLSFQVDTLIIAYFFPVATVSVYTVITKIFYIMQGAYGAIVGAIQPMIFRACESGDKEFIHKMAIKGFKYVLIFYSPLIYIAAILSQEFIFLWVGEEFSEYSIWSSIFLLQYVFSPAVGVLGIISIGMNKIKYIQVYGAITAVTNFILSLVFVNIFGFQGVILGTVTTTFLGVLIIYPFYCRALGLNWKYLLYDNYIELIVIISLMLFYSLVANYFILEGWLLLIFSAFVFTITTYAFMFKFFVYDEDKNKLLTLVSWR